MDRNNRYTLIRKFIFHFIIIALIIATITLGEKCDTLSNKSPYHFKYEKYIETKYAKDVSFSHINKSRLGDTKFINIKLNAKNVIEIPIYSSFTDSILKYYTKYVKPFLTFDRKCDYSLNGIKGHEFYCLHAPTWKSDVQWIQVNSRSAYDSLFPLFEEMGLNDIFRDIIDFDEKIIIYGMSFVVRSKVYGHNFHVDFYNTTNVNGFTLLTPLQDRSSINLAYIDLNGRVQQYLYKKGVAIVLGENFWHSTDLEANSKRYEILFCLCFGTDKLRDWTIIKRTAANQGLNYMHPLHGFTNNIERTYVI